MHLFASHVTAVQLPAGVRRLMPALLLALFCVAPPSIRAATPDPWSKLSKTALDTMAAQGRAVVVVSLDPAAVKQAAGDPARERSAVARTQQGVLDKLAAESGWHLRHRFVTVPYLVGEIDYSALGALAADPRVLAVAAESAVIAPADIESGNQIGATRARQVFGLTGAGANVGIVDTGIDLAHPDLAGSLVAGRRIMNQGTINDTDVQDDQGHGSHAAGVITGDGDVAPAGIAPDAGLVVVKALGVSGGFPSDVAAGIDWIVANNASFSAPVRFINLSLEVIGDLPAQCPCDNLPDFAVLTDAINAAADQGVVCIAAAGNDGDTVLRYPACLSRVVSAGASFDASYAYAPAAAGTYPTTGTFNAVGDSTFANCNHTSTVIADQLVCFSNRNLCMDFAAPGYQITSVKLGGGSRTSFGTSQATAHVTGALALLQQAAPTQTPAQLLQILHTTAVPIPLNQAQPTGLQVDRIDVLRAADRALRNAVFDWTLF